jgi:hypothetical protein
VPDFTGKYCGPVKGLPHQGDEAKGVVRLTGNPGNFTMGGRVVWHHLSFLVFFMVFSGKFQGWDFSSAFFKSNGIRRKFNR